ncbi:hypothetical protein GCM10027092_08730 [Yaniella soli]
MPSGKFYANAAWFVTAAISRNLPRAAGTLAGGDLGNARTVSLRQKLLNIAARLAHRARKLVLHLPFTHAWEVGYRV